MPGSLRSGRATRCSHSGGRARDTVRSHARAARGCARLPVRPRRRPDPDGEGARRRLEADVRRVPARAGRRAAASRSPFDSTATTTSTSTASRATTGVRSFLASRGIELPEGTPDDPPDGRDDRRARQPQERARAAADPRRRRPALRGLGRLRAAAREAGLRARGRLVEHQLPRRARRRPGSPTCSRRSSTASSPSASTWRASRRRTPSWPRRAGVELEPAQAAVFEDALAGVEAGRAGHFGFVVGVDRVGQAEALRAHGADVVVDDLAELLESP